MNISLQQRIISYLCRLLNEKNKATESDIREDAASALADFKCQQTIAARQGEASRSRVDPR